MQVNVCRSQCKLFPDIATEDHNTSHSEITLEIVFEIFYVYLFAFWRALHGNIIWHEGQARSPSV